MRPPAALHIAVISRTTGMHGVGGLERHTDELTATLAAMGHQVVLVTTTVPPAVLTADRPEQVICLPGTRPRRYTRAWLTNLLPILRELHGAEPFDLIVSQSTAAHSALNWILGTRVPLVYILHGSALENARHLAGRRDFKSALRRIRARRHWRQNARLIPRVPRVVTISRRLETSWREALDLGPDQLITLENPVAEGFRPLAAPARQLLRAELGWPSETMAVGYAGRIDPEKGISVLLDWIRTPAAVGCKLAIAGAGSPRLVQRIQHAAAAGGAVDFFGRLHGPELVAFYQRLDVFVLPSAYFEGLPMAMLEAMACGVPVVAYATGGVAEFFRAAQGAGGILVDPGDVRGLSRGLQQLREDPLRRQALGEAAAALTEGRRWPVWVARLLEFALH